MRRMLLLVPLALVLASLGPAPVSGADAFLPLGDADLVETRETTQLADGVTLTRIERGSEPARERRYQTTTRGPWLVNVLEIDPSVASGTLRASYGATLAQVEPVSALAAGAGALAAVNASFFTFTGSAQYPGDPVGLGIFDGEVLSEPTVKPAEVALLVDSRTNRIVMDRLTWAGRMINGSTGAVQRLEFLNHPPVVPDGCRKLAKPTRCKRSGDVVHLSPRFSTRTPSGKGVEVVLDRQGCVLRRAMTRGTRLGLRQTSVQATGRETVRLWRMSVRGCLTKTVELFRSNGTVLRTGPWLFGVNGRYRLTAAGRVVAPQGTDPFYARHPRTIAGRTGAGTVMLVTIDGRQSMSVGATLREAADVARSLGMANAVNLDGGGSTTMVAGGEVVSSPSGSQERAVGDALVFVPAADAG